MIAIQQSERNGKVVAATLVRPDDEIMLITDSGVLVRTRVAEIRELGRATQGVTLIALDDDAKLTGLQRIVENDANVDAGDRRRRRDDEATPTTEKAHDAPILSAGAGRRRWRSAVAGTAPAQTASRPAPPSARPRRSWCSACCALQQSDIEGVARSLVERPAAQMMREAGLALQQQQTPPEKREAVGKQIEAEVKKYVDEAYPLVRDRRSSSRRRRSAPRSKRR